MNFRLALLILATLQSPVLAYESTAEADMTGFDKVSINGDPELTSSEKAALRNPHNSMSSGNALSQQITRDTVWDPSTVPDNPENDWNGREYKATDARNVSQLGSSAASQTGTSLMSSAIPLLMSTSSYKRKAGRDLMEKASIEFQQAAASKRTAALNESHNRYLRQTANQTMGPTPQAGPQRIVVTPELEEYLGSKGISSQDFVDKMESGELGEAGSLEKFLGESPPDTQEEFDAATQLAQDLLNEHFEARGAAGAVKADEKTEGGAEKPTLAGIPRDDDSYPVVPEKQDASPTFAGVGAAAAVSGSPTLSLTSKISLAISKTFTFDKVAPPRDVKQRKFQKEMSESSTSFSSSSGYRSYGSQDDEDDISEARLRAAGVIRRGRGNIFHIAKYHYRSVMKKSEIAKIAGY